MRTILIALAVTTASLQSAHASIPNPVALVDKSDTAAPVFISKRVLIKLARHTNWQTMSYLSTGAGQDANALFLGSKLWNTFSDSEANLLKFTEISKLSIRENAAQPGKAELYSASLILNEQTKPVDFGLDFKKEADVTWTFRDLGREKFLLQTIDKRLSLIFIPADSEPDADRFKISESPPLNSYAGTAPLGFAASGYKSLFGLSVAPLAYLHHDISRPKRVRVSATFPRRYLPVIADGLKKWNKALGFKLFNLDLQTNQQVDPAECFANDQVCILWSGAADLPWTGFSGVTSISFNPVSGRIIGGTVTLTNAAPAGSLKVTPPEIVARISQNDPGISWIAEQALMTDKYAKLLHPFPNRFLDYFVVHELGHYIGLDHNFAGSIEGTAERPTNSIMDYLPFPAVIKANKIGPYDLSMIDLVYRKKLPNPKQPYCSGDQVSGEAWAPFCEQRDIGDTLTWFALWANMSSDGLFLPLDATNVSSKTGYSKQTMLDILIRYLNTSERLRAEKIICAQLNEPVEARLKEAGVTISCP